MYRSRAVVALALCAVLTPLTAVDLEVIPAEARWVIDLEVEKLMASDFGAVVEEISLLEEPARLLSLVQGLTGVDPRTDLESVTMAGGSQKAQDVGVLFRGAFDQQRMEDLVQAAEDYSRSSFSGVVIHRWSDKENGGHQYGAFLAPDHLIIAPNSDVIKMVVEVSRGLRPSLATVNHPVVEHLQQDDSVLMLAGAHGIQGMLNMVPNARLLRHIDDMEMVMRQDGQEMVLKMDAVFKTADHAEQIAKVLEGLRALTFLHDDPSRPVWLDNLIQEGEIAVNNETVSLSLRAPMDTVIEVINQRIEQNHGLRLMGLRERLRQRRQSLHQK